MFSDKLKSLRKKRGLTQSELAKQLNIGTSTIGMYESNIRKPSYSVLLDISNFFNVSIDYLIADDDIISDHEIEIFANNIKKLTPEQKQQVKNFIEFILNK